MADGDVELIGLLQVIGRFRSASAELRARLIPVMGAETEAVVETARKRLGELFRNPGAMQASIHARVSVGADVIEGSVVASGLPYLAIHEYGGTTRPHDIFPVNAKALAFSMGAGAVFRPGASAGTDMVFAKVVHHPGSVMPERSYMRYALAQRRAAISAAFLGATVDALPGTAAATKAA
jgi:phage gpG-like protein